MAWAGFLACLCVRAAFRPGSAPWQGMQHASIVISMHVRQGCCSMQGWRGAAMHHGGRVLACTSGSCRSSAPLPPRQSVQLGQAGALQARCLDGLERTAAYLCAPSSALFCKGTAAPAPAAAHDTTLTRRRGVAPLSVALCYHRDRLTVVCVQLLSLCATPWQRCLQINLLSGAVLCFRR